MTSGMPMLTRTQYMERLFRRYRRITLPLFGRAASEAKSDGSAVTEADRAASAAVLRSLIRHTPAYGAISEEEKEPHLPDAAWQWAIDPLDGTAAFARGLPVWGVGIGLMHNAVPREGYLDFPVVGESYVFHGGVGLLNGARITRRKVDFAPDCRNVLITAIHGYIDVRRLQPLRLHNFGSNLYHMMALATGRCEAIITGPCQIWDLAPALPFTRALGYVERYLDGSPLMLKDLLARSDFGFPVKQPLFVGAPGVVASLLKLARRR